jgi:hypothetical protein
MILNEMISKIKEYNYKNNTNFGYSISSLLSLKQRKPTKKELAFKRLKEIDLNNSKEALYRVSIDGAMFVSESNKRLFEEIEREGVEYKYKKETKELSEDLRQKIESFISSIKLERKDDK